MQKLIQFLFGQPGENVGTFKTEFMLFGWFLVVFYTCGIISFCLQFLVQYSSNPRNNDAYDFPIYD